MQITCCNRDCSYDCGNQHHAAQLFMGLYDSITVRVDNVGRHLQLGKQQLSGHVHPACRSQQWYPACLLIHPTSEHGRLCTASSIIAVQHLAYMRALTCPFHTCLIAGGPKPCTSVYPWQLAGSSFRQHVCGAIKPVCSNHNANIVLLAPQSCKPNILLLPMQSYKHKIIDRSVCANHS